MNIEREMNTATWREHNKKKRQDGYRLLAVVVVGILLGAAGITALLGGGTHEEEPSLALPPSSGVSTNILAPLPMQGGSSSLYSASFGPVPLAENEYQILSQSANTIRQPETGQVSLEYFSDAAFLGDSLTVGFVDYNTNLGGALICAYAGAGPNLIVNESTLTHPTRGEEIPLQVITDAQPNKVYLLLGTNTLVATGNETSFLGYYEAMIEKLYQNLGDDTLIYVQSIPPVTEAAVTADKAGLESTRLQSINESLALLCVEKGCIYLDLWEVFADENGNLNADLASPDGIHFSAGDGYTTWVNYLRSHATYDAENPWTAGSVYAN